MRRLSVIFILLVLLTGVGINALSAQDSATPISYGDTVTGQITGSSPELLYSFEASEGDIVVINMASEDFDTQLFVLDASGSEVATNDDGGEGSNSLIRGFTIPASGVYTIRATGFLSSGVGNFTLSLSTLQVRPIEYGQIIDSEIPADQPSVAYGFTATEGDVVVINLKTAAFGADISLNNPSGSEVATGRYIDSERRRLWPQALEQSGAYTVFVAGSGAFTLEVKKIEPLTLTAGEAVSAELTADDQALFFAVDVTTPVVYDLVVESGLDTTLRLIHPYGYEVNSVSGVDTGLSGAGLNSKGTYYVIIEPTDADEDVTSTVSVTLAEAELAALDDGPVTVELTESVTEQTLVFEGSEDEIARLMLVITAIDQFAYPTLEITQNGSSLVYYSLSNLRRISFDLLLEESGSVSVRLSSSYPLTADITLERNPE